jgi:transcriptional regulator with XRE-family HTH domain
MTGQDLRTWRKQWKITQEELAGALGVYRVTVNRWERGVRSIPSFLPLALEALEHRLQKGGKDGLTSGVPGVQETE